MYHFMENKINIFGGKIDFTPAATLLALVRNSKKSFILLILTLYFRILEHCICESEGGYAFKVIHWIVQKFSFSVVPFKFFLK